MAKNKFDKHDNKLVFIFDNKEAANHFKAWLCESGEQEYWTWMEEQEQREKGNITGLNFDYHSGDETIPVQCGRRDCKSNDDKDWE